MYVCTLQPGSFTGWKVVKGLVLLIVENPVIFAHIYPRPDRYYIQSSFHHTVYMNRVQKVSYFPSFVTQLVTGLPSVTDLVSCPHRLSD